MAESKSAYVEKLKAQMDQWDAEIATLAAKARGAQADTKLRFEEELTALRQKRDAAQTRLSELQASSDGAWEEVKSGAQAAWSDMTGAMERARAKFQ